MLVSLTVGKVDAGVTVLLTPDKRLIEFPSILLPPNIVSGSIVDITVARNHESEAKAGAQFSALQDHIFSSFGASQPSTPVLRCRNATQTSVVLDWDPIDLATADLISLSLYRNNQKAGNIPRPMQMHSTKISGLAVDTEYSFHLVLRTTAGTFSSKQVVVRTHKMTDLSGVTITTGFLPAHTREELTKAVERIGAKIVDGVRIDTTHFVTTEGRGVPWEKAVEMNIPVVRPEWVDACEKNGRILGVTKFYLDALRPSPSSSQETPTVASPPPAPAQHQKDLPRAPAQNAKNEEPEPHKGERNPKEEESSGDDDNDNNDDNNNNKDDKATKAAANVNGEEEKADEPKAKATDEQKARFEDKDAQKVPLQPADKPSPENATTKDVGSGADDSSDEKGPVNSPGDGASFQDVAL
ncbi:hypothetical protein GGS23DRAFT_602720 [Durotheca rogersii]|uniref:uncharacterized protein n=1 Tax=Durotheca rogersii TaxID=419775 RepID=UPI00221FE2B4|nr:uncharacterized protein GGS23DRAFT_602720 [Durotheca rogersii]KAI5867800.1 hypothetical protein GGS23DRAFT_602720 [Durotheca rogersii]